MQNTTREKTLSNSKSILKEVCEITNFNYGEIWIPDRRSNFLELSSDYYVVEDLNQNSLRLFHKCSEGFIMSNGEGLPGRVFLTREPEWMLDVSVESEESFLRNKIAGVCGVITGFAVPVIKENSVLMIIAFFSTEFVNHSPRYLRLASNLTKKLLL